MSGEELTAHRHGWRGRSQLCPRLRAKAGGGDGRDIGGLGPVTVQAPGRPEAVAGGSPGGAGDSLRLVAAHRAAAPWFEHWLRSRLGRRIAGTVHLANVTIKGF